MALDSRVHIARRFQRSIRIDTDLGVPTALEGFICPRSSAEVLLSMATHISESNHCAFTWTGPFGSGKSSLVIVLSALLGKDDALRKDAAAIIGKDYAKKIWGALPPKSQGWCILPVVGQKEDPTIVIADALNASGLADFSNKDLTQKNVLHEVKRIALHSQDMHGGLIIFIDEMGKILEGAAQEGFDIYIFQQLAELASRSNGRLILVGVLHQAFQEYSTKLSRDMRDEWTKIQGRFIDLAVNTAGEEQIDLISRAIESNYAPLEPGKLSETILDLIRNKKPSVSPQLAQVLEECWPLHPIVACLLGPISRRRFGQNQRSIFGFLNSAEPSGFQDFLKNAEDGMLYDPDKLWDYLRINLEPSILASPDGHRWALAVDALERCESIGGSALHIKILKVIALVDLFKDRSGLVANAEMIESALHGFGKDEIKKSLDQLKTWSFILFRKFTDAFTIYAGSDFDIDQAIELALKETRDIDFLSLRNLAGLQPVLAKRHYHETGTLWWFDVELVPLCELREAVESFKPHQGTIGQFLLAIPTEGETEDQANHSCSQASAHASDTHIIIGISKRSWYITATARELLALEKVLHERSELAGDAVARREVRARLVELQSQLETELNRLFDNASWFYKDNVPKRKQRAELSILASDIADARFNKSPKIYSELLNRIKPSSSAVAAQNALLRKMVLNEADDRLGIVDFPAEGGLYSSILDVTGLHVLVDGARRFVPPGEFAQDSANLKPLWKVATSFLKKNSARPVPVSEIFDLWRKPPYGVKDGLLPVLSIAYLLSHKNTLAFYRQGIFQAKFRDLEVDFLINDPSDIQLRWMDLSETTRKLLSGMADIVRELDADNPLQNLEPIDVARGLIAIYDRLQPWTKRTTRLSGNAIKIRNLFKQANDPNQFLFEDLPGILGKHVEHTRGSELSDLVRNVHDGLEELVQAYPNMLRLLRDTMFAELQVPNTSFQSLAELRDRAENIKQIAGDFKLEAFVGRLMQFDGSHDAIEGIASLAANKPPRDWVDIDLDRATIELTDYSQKFLRTETFARVKGRENKRHSMAVVVGVGGRPTPVLREFDISESDRSAINSLIAEIENALQKSDQGRKNVILAALAELSARYINEKPSDEPLHNEVAVL